MPGSHSISMSPYFPLFFLRIAGSSVECGPRVDSNFLAGTVLN